jgi:hypothetical protein
MQGGTAKPRRPTPRRPAVALATDWDAARTDLGAFAAVVGSPLTPAQARLGELDRRITVVIAPRQTGKSRTLAVLATWWAFRHPDSNVLVVSASDDAAKRLLAMVRDIVTRPPLLASVETDLVSTILLSNGSTIRSVPASEKAIRGWSVDLLLVDEASLVTDDVLLGAALPTTSARPGARIVLAGTPWAMSGAMYAYAQAGDTPHVRVLGWTLADAPWIDSAVIEHARATMPDFRFQTEMEARWVSDGSAYFSAQVLQDATADYVLTHPQAATGGAVIVGLDWGRQVDAHGIAVVGVSDDGNRNGRAVLLPVWIEASRRPYHEQVELAASIGKPRPRATVTWRGGWERVERPIQPMGNGMTLYQDARTFIGAQRLKEADARPGYHVVRWVSETNGVGQAPTDDLIRRVGSSAVIPHTTSQRSKEDELGRIAAYLADGRMVLPASAPDLLRQLLGLQVRATPTGALSVQAGNPAIHDDLADALCLAISAVPWDLAAGITTVPDETEWVTTPSGVHVPRIPRPRRAALADPRRSMVTR